MGERRKKSKKRSGANWRKQLKRHSFFLDQCLGRGKIAAALRGAGARVILHEEHFPANAPDTVWLPAVGRRGWAVLTKDKEIRRREIERQALLHAGIAAFVLTSADLTGEEIAAAFVKALPRMVRCLREQHRPFIAAVHRDGSVQVLAESRRALIARH